MSLIRIKDQMNSMFNNAIKDKIINHLTNTVIITLLITIAIMFFTLNNGTSAKTVIYSSIITFLLISFHDYGVKNRNNGLKSNTLNNKFSQMMTGSNDNYDETINQFINN